MNIDEIPKKDSEKDYDFSRLEDAASKAEVEDEKEKTNNAVEQNLRCFFWSATRIFIIFFSILALMFLVTIGFYFYEIIKDKEKLVTFVEKTWKTIANGAVFAYLTTLMFLIRRR